MRRSTPEFRDSAGDASEVFPSLYGVLFRFETGPLLIVYIFLDTLGAQEQNSAR